MTTVPQVGWALGFGSFAILLTFVPFIMAWHNYIYAKTQIDNHLPYNYLSSFIKITVWYFLIGGVFFASIKMYDFFVSRVIDRFGSVKLFDIFWSTTINTGAGRDGTIASLYNSIYFIKEIIFSNILIIFSIIYFIVLILMISYKANYHSKRQDNQGLIFTFLSAFFDLTLGVLFYNYIYIRITDLILHWEPNTVGTLFIDWWRKILL